jgi:hypothetical protein
MIKANVPGSEYVNVPANNINNDNNYSFVKVNDKHVILKHVFWITLSIYLHNSSTIFDTEM